MTDTISLNGHNVPADRADQFLSGRTGRPLTDAEWDEQKRRIEAAEALTGDDQVTWAWVTDGEDAS